ncbi:MAG: hypothetical protein ABIN20_01470 [candidate division WOR-3 bacterium]
MGFKILKVLSFVLIGFFYQGQVSMKELKGEYEKPQKVFIEGQRGWAENGTYLWTAVLTYNVGIGTSTPIYKLDVVGNSRIQGDLYINSWPIRIQSAPSAGQVLKWNAAQNAFIPDADAGGTGNQVVYTSEASTSSNTWVDVPGMSITITTGNQGVFVLAVLRRTKHFSSGSIGYYRLLIDGVQKVYEEVIYGFTNDTKEIVLSWYENLSAGTHTIKVQWCTNVATLYMNEGGKATSNLIVWR